ncbi:sodium/potassium-transporting ATPase subunit beta-1-like [Ruditapes philippinarum]|uniref:sodium/potassium-transporting ATPase subunit beta-1-like n=1 Tax=Ruditapes philippinarum TaxID=129788 RepID=UPI00295B7ECB|nr:sodium/potassium-transporting ATPase subunit beta-1-like [Ruditapes philippinarum]
MLVFQFLSVLLFSTYGLCQTYDELKTHLPERPQFNGAMGRYLNYPELVYEPKVEAVEEFIRIVKGRRSTYDVFQDRITTKLMEYENMFKGHDERMIDCESISGYRPLSEWDKNCRFDLMALGPDCVKQTFYGFDDGQPCILLSLDRILNWLPEPYTNETVPDKIRNSWAEFAITVHCEGEDPVTKDNLGDILYYPPQGFPFRYFPNTGKEGWKNPLVFVQLADFSPAIALRVTCSAYAKNIKHDDMFQTGKVSFIIMVD